MILTIIGARPQFIKAAVVSKALLNAGISEEIIHTGQHYDEKLSTIFWEELNIPPYKENLNVGSGHHGKQTAEMITKIESLLLPRLHEFKAVMVYGDTNSTLAGALVAAKLNLKLIHIESGVRSFNRTMPEEVNRIVTDRLANLLFCSSKIGKQQLEKEGILENVFDCGDVMYDAVETFLPIALSKNKSAKTSPFNGSPYSLLTLHRPANVDDLSQLKKLLTALFEIPTNFLWPTHPRVAHQLSSINFPETFKLIEPLGYFDMLKTLYYSNKVFTDSGGLQKEAYWLKKPCITLRTETEWVETLENDWNILVCDFSESKKLQEAYLKKIDDSSWKPLYGHGNAATQIASILKKVL